METIAIDKEEPSLNSEASSPAGPHSLNALQVWMQAVLQNPDGTDAETTPSIASVLNPSSRRTSEQRLQVYCNAYFARLLGCLRDEFGSLQQFLGTEIFDGLAAAYLSEYPSRSHTLADLGARFPQFLEESRSNFGDLDVSPETGVPPWTQFLIDLANLERTQAEVFDGPGTEGLPLLSSTRLQQITPETWPNLRFRLAPCLRLLKLAFPVHDYIHAIRRDADAPLPQHCPTWLAITRRQYFIRQIPLEQDEFQLLNTLASGSTLGEALELVATQHHSVETLMEDVRRWFHKWAMEGFFTAVE